MYDFIINEYEGVLVEIRKFNSYIQGAPQGYISKKNINEKCYYYLQKRVNGRVESKYLKVHEVEATRLIIERCGQYKDRLKAAKVRQSELEQASKLLSRDLYKQLIIKKMCDAVSQLSIEEKENSICFANALNAVEGVGISHILEQDIENWKQGKLMYSELLPNVMSRVVEAGGM